MKGPALFAAAIVTCGCAQSPSTDETMADDPVTGGAYANDDRVCERVRRTGTHRSTVICRSRAEVERDAVEGKQTFDTLRNSQRNSGEYK